MSRQHDWRVVDHALRHPQHGLFIVHVSLHGEISASRCAGSSPDYQHERLGTWSTVDEAKAACERRIAELDAQARAQTTEAVP